MEEGVYQLGHAHELSSLFAELTMLDNADEVNFSVIRDLDLEHSGTLKRKHVTMAQSATAF